MEQLTEFSDPNWDIVDIHMATPSEAYILATYKHGPTNYSAYCLRWMPEADATIMPSQPGTTPTAPTTVVPAKPPTIAGSSLPGPEPLLDWSGQGPFQAAGVTPVTGKPVDPRGYHFQVVYRHPRGKPPIAVALEIEQLKGAQWTLAETSRIAGGYANGAIFDCYIDPTVFRPGTKHRYRFTATDGQHSATGEPTKYSDQRIFETPPAAGQPTLTWWGQGSFATRGVKPTSGPVTNSNGYQFRIMYIHPDNKAPQNIAVEIEGLSKQWPMQVEPRYGTDYRAGAVYDAWIKPSELPAGKRLKYRFVADDGNQSATGPPTQWDISRTFATPR
jgi:hypothetical protein